MEGNQNHQQTKTGTSTMGNIIMSRKELEQVKVFEKLKNKQITQVETAKILKLSVRWVRKKYKRYLAGGEDELVHKNRGKQSMRRIDQAIVNTLDELTSGILVGAGPLFVAEKLQENNQMSISKESVRRLMIKNGSWLAKRGKVKHRKRRERRLSVGAMIQFDGSPHDWFEGRGERCTLLVGIDDATSRIMWLQFAGSESIESVMTATKNYLLKYGRPLSLYVDFGSVFSVNTNNQDREKKTQFERALHELDIELIHAHSPQAKGRVERSNHTLQDRLVKELRIAGISTIEDANKFVQEHYIDKHNAKFSIAPAETTDMHRPITGFNLERILCVREQRTVQNDFVVSYKKRLLQLDKYQRTIVRPKNIVTVSHLLNGKIELSIRKTLIGFKEISKEERMKRLNQSNVSNKSLPAAPWNKFSTVSSPYQYNPKNGE